MVSRLLVREFSTELDRKLKWSHDQCHCTDSRYLLSGWWLLAIDGFEVDVSDAAANVSDPWSLAR